MYSLIFILINSIQLIHSLNPITDYPNITHEECGIGRQPLQPNDNTCFKYHKNFKSAKINLARNASEFEVPWIVLIVIHYGDPRSQCGATLLNRFWIITAAHCVFCDDDPCDISKMFVYIGVLSNQKSNNTENRYSIDKVIVNPNYLKSGKLESDVALIKLNHSVRFIKEVNYWRIIPLCLPESNYANIEDEQGLVAGWGTTSSNSNQFATTLQIAWIKLQALSNDSQDDFGRFIVVKRTEDRGAIACFGDSGGPLFQYYNGRAVLIGVTAGSVMADPDSNCPGNDYREAVLYTRVSLHISWICETIVENN